MVLFIYLISDFIKNPVLSFPSLCLPPGEGPSDSPYEDVKLSPMCLPIARPQIPKVREVCRPFRIEEYLSPTCLTSDCKGKEGRKSSSLITNLTFLIIPVAS